MSNSAAGEGADYLREAASRMDVSLDDGQISSLVRYVGLISKWNKVYNLTAVRDPQQMMVQHVLDSLAIVPFLRQMATPQFNVLDVGSGAGLPGVVVAIALPRTTVTCVDAVGKKASFIQQVASELSQRNLSALHARIESLAVAPVDLITARAFSSLKDLVVLSYGLLKPNAMWMAMKGKFPSAEIAELPQSVEVFHVEPLKVPNLDAARCIVWMRKK